MTGHYKFIYLAHQVQLQYDISMMK